MDPKPILIRNARLVDPASGKTEHGAIALQDGVIAALGAGIDAAPEGAEVIDAKGMVVAPGLIDLRAFVGEPGHEYRETLASASRAAAAGGVTTVVTMPDTHPPVDDPADATACDSYTLPALVHGNYFTGFRINH